MAHLAYPAVDSAVDANRIEALHLQVVKVCGCSGNNGPTQCKLDVSVGRVSNIGCRYVSSRRAVFMMRATLTPGELDVEHFKAAVLHCRLEGVHNWLQPRRHVGLSTIAGFSGAA